MAENLKPREERTWKNRREKIEMEASSESEKWEEKKARFYKKDCICLMHGGAIFFSETSMSGLEGGEGMGYDEYLDIQRQSLGKIRASLIPAFADHGLVTINGRIGKIDRVKKMICFPEAWISAWDRSEYWANPRPVPDYTPAKEDNLWMALDGFENFKVGDCVSFTAEVYRFVKFRNDPFRRPVIDFGVRNPENIKKENEKNLPTEEDLLEFRISQILCEMCMYEDHCYGHCIASEDWVVGTRALLREALEDSPRAKS